MAFAAILPRADGNCEAAAVELWDIGRDDASTIITGIFDANAKLDRVLELLEEDDEEEEAEEDS